MSKTKFFFFVDNKNAKSQQAAKEAKDKYNRDVVPDVEDADIVVVFGGDGTMLSAAKMLFNYQLQKKEKFQPIPQTKIMGFNCGNVGALMNPLWNKIPNLLSLSKSAETVTFHPLETRILTNTGEVKKQYAFNEVALMGRSTQNQACHLKIITGKPKRTEGSLSADGVIVSTPAGSSGYFKSAGGKPFAFGSEKMGIQPVCPIKKSNIPSMVSDAKNIIIDVQDKDKRPVWAFTDNAPAVTGVRTCFIRSWKDWGVSVLLGKNSPARLCRQHI